MPVSALILHFGVSERLSCQRIMTKGVQLLSTEAGNLRRFGVTHHHHHCQMHLSNPLKSPFAHRRVQKGFLGPVSVCVWRLPHTNKQFSGSAGCPKIQLNFDTICSEIESGSTDRGLSPTRLPSASDVRWGCHLYF